MNSFKKYVPSILLCSILLLSLTAVSMYGNAHAGQQTSQVTNVQSSVNVINKKGAARIYQIQYGFTKNLTDDRARGNKKFYNKKVNYSQIAKTNQSAFYKTKKGWLNGKAFNQFLIAHKYSHFNYRMKVVHNGNLYNLPAHINNAVKVGTTNQLGLLNQWVGVNGVAETNTDTGYYRFGYQNQNYWINGNDLMFNLNSLRGHNHRLERALAAGERMIGHSKYNEKTRHYDCSSFIRHIFAKGDRYVGSTTYSQIDNGRRDNPRHLKRGDMIFFNTCYSTDAYNHKISGINSHVAVYLGNGLILQDSPYTDNGGVDVTSLRDPMWNSRSKYPEVHHFNGIARRVF